MAFRPTLKSPLQSSLGLSRARLREAQLLWLEWIGERTGDTLSAIARKADKNPGTLTEIRNGEKDRVLSDATVEDIKHAYGVPGPLEFSTTTGFAEDAVPYSGTEPTDNLTTDRWELRSNVLEAVGLLPGDDLYVDLSRLPHDGDIVCAQLFTGLMQAKTAFRLYRNAGRFAVLTTAFHDQRQNTIDIVGSSDVAVKGVVTRTARRMALV